MIEYAMSRVSWIRSAGLTIGLMLAATVMPQTPPVPATASPNAPLSSSWLKLTAKEKRALAPLASRWGELSDIQKGKWLSISLNFDQLSPAEKSTMHARMSEWVSLSPVQRTQARLNFNASQSLPKDEKKAKWDEYQSLTAEQKRQLSAVNQGPTKTTAPSSKPANAERFVAPPPAWQASNAASAARSRAPIDQKTLLPIPSEAPAKTTSPQPEASHPRDDSSST